jgi:hypothetical protein
VSRAGACRGNGRGASSGSSSLAGCDDVACRRVTVFGATVRMLVLTILMARDLTFD